MAYVFYVYGNPLRDEFLEMLFILCRQMTKIGSLWNDERQGLALSTAGLVLTALQDVNPDMGQPLPQDACHQLVTI